MRAGSKGERKGAKPNAREEFLAAVGDVHRLPPSNQVRPGPAPPAAEPRQRLADERAALAESLGEMEPDTAVEFEPEQSYLRPGLRSDTLRKLRRRFWSIQDQLDLHGHNRAEAHEALRAFLAASHRAGYRCVRVIHGKGLSSPGREPVLKGQVRRWLQRADLVLAYCEPAAVDGGAGAVLVLLKAS